MSAKYTLYKNNMGACETWFVFLVIKNQEGAKMGNIAEFVEKEDAELFLEAKKMQGHTVEGEEENE